MHETFLVVVSDPQEGEDTYATWVVNFFKPHSQIKIFRDGFGSLSAEDFRSLTAQTKIGCLVVVVAKHPAGKRCSVIASAVNPSEWVLARYLWEYFDIQR